MRWFSLFLLTTGTALLGGCANSLYQTPLAIYGPHALINSAGTRQPVSDSFAAPQANRLYEVVTSTGFAASLLPYTCGDPLPKFKYTVALWNANDERPRNVQVAHDPGLALDGKTRCLVYGFDFQTAKAIATLDPSTLPSRLTEVEPVCNCTR